MEQQNIFNYWGKAGNDESYHLLIYHCLDVAAVGREWLKQSSSFTKEAAKKLGLTEKGFIEWFTFFLALHDIGKFDIGFQNLRPDLLKILQQRESRSIYSTRHDQCGYNFWNNGIFLHIYYTSFESEKMANIKSYFDIFAKVTLGHHGLPPENKSSIKNIPDIVLDFTEKLLSLFVSEQSIDELKNLISLEKVERKTIIKESKNFSWKLAGLTTLCDWIASGDKAFIYISTREDLSEYFKSACNKAKEALSRSEVVSTKLSESVGIEHLFPQFSNSPTPLQRFCNETEISLSPQLWILEDVAGAGKTEAALTLTSRILKKNSGTGCFVALPTMATSNAMYERMAEVYSLLYDDGAKPSLSLSHGSSHLSEKFRNSFTTNLPDLPGDGEVFDENVEEGKAHCSQWLADSSKKALLADVGVGTVDQLLLAGLPVRYQSLRAFGMSQKVLIIDEVHAFDAYMLQVLTNIIATQASFGGSVVLLSATLPLSVREKFCDAFTKGLGIEEQEIRKHNKFPLVTSIDKHGIKETAVDTRDSVKRKVQLSFCEDIENVYSLIEQSVNEGKCVCWIRNTITDVSIAYEELDSRNIENWICFIAGFR